MPKAVVSQDTERLDLKTLPGGFVELRRLSYGEILRRRDMAQSIRDSSAENGQAGVEGVFHVSVVTHYEFTKAIIDHNLEDDDGRKLNFADMKDLSKLDPRIAGEIEDKIAAMNEPPKASTNGAEKELSFRGPSDTSDSPRSEGSPKGS